MMRKIITILILLCTYFGYSQVSQTKINPNERKIKSSDVGIDVGDFKGIESGIIYNWSVPICENENTTKEIVNNLIANLSGFGAEVNSFQFKDKTLHFNFKVGSPVPPAQFKEACRSAGFTYIKTSEGIKFINLK